MFEYKRKTAAPATKYEPSKQQHLLITRTSGHPCLHCIKHMLAILTVIHHKYTINKFALYMRYFQMRRQCVVVDLSGQGHFNVCFCPFCFINNLALWKCFFLSRTENRSDSEMSKKLESKTDDLTFRNSHFDLFEDRAYKFNVHVDNAATRNINDTNVPAECGRQNAKENLVSHTTPNQVNRIEVPLKFGYWPS